MSELQPAPTAGLRLTQEGNVYSRELRLYRGSDGAHAGVWIQSAGNQEWICRRAFDAAGTREVEQLAPTNAPGSPSMCGEHLFWLEYGDARGMLLHCDPDRRVTPVAAMPVNFGDYSCAMDADGALWVIAEQWEDRKVFLGIYALDNGRWKYRGRLDGESGFCRRPRLVNGLGGLMAIWDQYRDGAYRVCTASVGDGRRHQQFPSPGDCWETLPALACTVDGQWYAARCRERRVELPDNICGYHSELVVALLVDGVWRDIAAVDIDHGMNPWMAPYMGRRRAPYLIADVDGVWLLWEEKIDADSMKPSLGRLCALRVTSHGAQWPARVVLDGFSEFMVEDGAGVDKCFVATKAQFHFGDQYLPYVLHRVTISAAHAPRPQNLASHRDAPGFFVHPLAARRPCMEAEGYQLYFGDLHLHSRWSQDLDGEQDELYHFARDVARLDFAAFTENDFHWLVEPLPAAVWQQSLRQAEYFNDPGRFTAFIGWEYTKHASPDGSDTLDSHRCVIFPDSEGKVYSWHSEEMPSPAKLARRFAGQRVLLHHHHPHGYDISDDTVERNIEICSGWWNCMEMPHFVKHLHRILDEGYRLGFYGGSDNHERNPGLGGALAGVWAKENTRQAIFDALWRRRVFATTGLRPDLRFQVSGACMGSETSTTDAPRIHLQLHCERPVKTVAIVRDGEVVHTDTGDSTEYALEWLDTECPAGSHYYYAHVRFAGEGVNPYWNIASAYGVDAWSSPVWVMVHHR